MQVEPNIHTLVDGHGRALKLLLSAGNVVDIKMAPALVEDLTLEESGTLTADRRLRLGCLAHYALGERKLFLPCRKSQASGATLLSQGLLPRAGFAN